MKSFLFKLSLSLLLLLTASFFCAAQSVKDIVFENTSQKFKKVDEGESLTFTYNFKYLGDNPLTINPPNVDCSCTEVIFPTEKIEANKTYTVTIKFDTHDKIGWQQREVLLQFVLDKNNSQTIDVKLVFKGMIKASKATKKAYKENKKSQKE